MRFYRRIYLICLILAAFTATKISAQVLLGPVETPSPTPTPTKSSSPAPNSIPNLPSGAIEYSARPPKTIEELRSAEEHAKAIIFDADVTYANYDHKIRIAGVIEGQNSAYIRLFRDNKLVSWISCDSKMGISYSVLSNTYFQFKPSDLSDEPAGADGTKFISSFVDPFTGITPLMVELPIQDLAILTDPAVPVQSAWVQTHLDSGNTRIYTDSCTTEQSKSITISYKISPYELSRVVISPINQKVGQCTIIFNRFELVNSASSMPLSKIFHLLPPAGSVRYIPPVN
jgi:hypothetical protein